MPRLQHHHHHHHHSSSPAKPISLSLSTSTPSTPLRPKAKQTMTKLLPSSTTTPIKKTSPTTPHKPSSTKPNPPSYRKQHSKSKTKNMISPNPTKNHGTLSLLSFYDLSAELYALSSHSNPKLKPSNRRPKKSSNHHALVLPQSSDSEEVHSIFLPFTSQHSSRSSTPTPTKTCGMAPSDPLDHSPFTLELDDSLSPFLTSETKTTPPRTFPTTSTPSLPPPRRHVRAKSVASIFEFPKSTKVQPEGVRDDWDMPTALPRRDLTWQQKGKKAPLQTHSAPSVNRSQTLMQPDSLKSFTATMANPTLKEATTPARHQKSTLARTSSAGTISRLVPPSAHPTHPPPSYSSRSDDESALTWQQTIIRPLPKTRPSPTSHSNHTLSPIVGAQVDATPPRRHIKSHTHQPASLSNRKSTQSFHNHAPTSAPAFSNIPESIHPKMMTTPSKSRSTSENMNLASPEKQLTTPALRAAFMYAGPQFHNSPCPAALPAPKFSFGSA